MKLSILIPYRPDGGPRDVLWQWLRQRYDVFFPHAEMIVAGETASLPFNRPRAANQAADMATGDIYVIGDADTAFNPEFLRRAIKHVARTGDWMVPTTYHQLTEETTREIVAGAADAEIGEPTSTVWTGHGSSVAPILVTPAKAFHQVGGYDERYVGWGSDDRAFAVAMNTLYRHYVRWQGASYHLFHPRGNQHDSNASLTLAYVQADGDAASVSRLRSGSRL
jgi:hypothetical protein